MFELNRCLVKITKINLRTENHGEEHVLANDVLLLVIAHNSILDHIDEDLKKFLYCKRPPVEGEQAPIDDEDMPDERFPLLESLHWGYEGVGYEAIFHIGIDQSSELSIEDCKVNKLQIEPQENGTVRLKLRLQMNPSTLELAKLAALNGEKVELTLTPPSVEDLDGDVSFG